MKFSLKFFYTNIFGKLLLIFGLSVFYVGTGTDNLVSFGIESSAHFSIFMVIFMVSMILEFGLYPSSENEDSILVRKNKNENFLMVSLTRYFSFVMYCSLFQRFLSFADIDTQQIMVTFSLVWLLFMLFWWSIKSIGSSDKKAFYISILNYSKSLGLSAILLTPDSNAFIWFGVFVALTYTLVYLVNYVSIIENVSEFGERLIEMAIICLVGFPFFGMFDLKFHILNTLLNDGFTLEVFLIYLSSFVLIYSYLTKKRNIPYASASSQNGKIIPKRRILFELSLVLGLAIFTSIYSLPLNKFFN